MMRKQPKDRIEDFDDVYSFGEVFDGAQLEVGSDASETLGLTRCFRGFLGRTLVWFSFLRRV